MDATGTPFQQRVWEALRAIPAGDDVQLRRAGGTGRLAGRGARRGSGNGANPAWLVVPCHRVVRSDGSLGGYGGGLDRKRGCSTHEGAAGHNGWRGPAPARS